MEDVNSRVAWIKWLFQDNPAVAESESLTIYTYCDDKGIVGQLGILPCPTFLHGNFVRNGWCVDFHVLERAQRKGVGGKLLQAAYTDFEMLSTLGQTDLSYNLFLKLGWHQIGLMTSCKRLLNIQRAIPKMLIHKAKMFKPNQCAHQVIHGWSGDVIGTVAVKILSNLSGCEELMADRNSYTQKCFVKKTVELMNWRYVNCPQEPYTILLLNHGGAQAIAVLRLYTINGWRRGHLIDLLYGGTMSADQVSVIMHAIEIFMSKSGVEVFEAETSDAQVLNWFASGPLSVKTQTTRFLYGTPDGSVFPTAMRDWMLFTGDCDIDIVNGLFLSGQ